MPETLTFAEYESYAVRARKVLDLPARKAALLILSSEIRGTVWTDDVAKRATLLAAALLVEAISIDARPLEALKVILRGAQQ